MLWRLISWHGNTADLGLMSAFVGCMCKKSGAGCSKLTTSLVKVSLNFQT